MSDATPIVTTSRAGLELVDAKLRTQYDQMIAAISDRLTADHAFLFARPEPSLGGDGSSISWFAESPEDAAPLYSMPFEEQEEAIARLERLESDIRHLARALRAEGPASAELGRLIEAALERPPGDTAFVVGRRPVIVNWGYKVTVERDGPSDKGRQVVAINVAPALPVTPAGPATAAGGGAGAPPGVGVPPTTTSGAGRRALSRRLIAWLLWLLFVALLLVSGYLLLRACALDAAGWPRFIHRLLPDECASPVAADDADLTAVVARLRQEIQSDEAALLIKATSCPASCPIPPGPVQDLRQQRTETGGQPAERQVEEEELCSPVELPADAKRGELELDLSWNTNDDLDLSMKCPDGKVVSLSQQKKFGCGAEFDTDIIPTDGELISQPIEHIVWSDLSAAPSGRYEVFVHPFRKKSSGGKSQPFNLYLNLRGRKVLTVTGTAKNFGSDERNNMKFMDFTLPLSAQDGPPARPTEGRTASGKPCRIGGDVDAAPGGPAKSAPALGDKKQ